jgi:hypothetical protein
MALHIHSLSRQLMTAACPAWLPSYACRHTNQTGVPLMRPLWFEFPEQAGLYGVEEEFLLGPGILVKPVLQVGAVVMLLLLLLLTALGCTVWREAFLLGPGILVKPVLQVGAALYLFRIFSDGCALVEQCLL